MSDDSGGLGQAGARAFVVDEWRRVWEIKASLEQRAIVLITTSGVLVTLAFGFTAAITKSGRSANFTRPERVILTVAVALFICSAITALTVNVPKGYDVPDYQDVLLPTAEHSEATVASIPPDRRLLNAISVGRQLNDAKAYRLTYAFGLQLLAIATLGVVVAVVTA